MGNENEWPPTQYVIQQATMFTGQRLGPGGAAPLGRPSKGPCIRLWLAFHWALDWPLPWGLEGFLWALEDSPPWVLESLALRKAPSLGPEGPLP